jgi:3-phosphoshikimate 1-carboxyvinyltransferase
VRAIELPGDKSIAHRFLILASLADGPSLLSNVPDSLDVLSTGSCLDTLGAVIEDLGAGRRRVAGRADWSSPAGPLDCGNSGTTARLLAGLLTGLGIEAVLTGDASLRGRPMDRVVYPLQAMGGRISYLESTDRLPVRVESRATGALRPLRYRPRVSSAQVRGALLLAAVAGRVDLEITDHLRPRDHTERILKHMGAPVASSRVETGDRVRLGAAEWDGRLQPLRARVPGDVSSAAFLLVAALLNERELELQGVGVNPTRTGFVRLLQEAGASVEIVPTDEQAGEPVGDLTLRSSSLTPFTVEADVVPQLIDEIPALAVLASRLEGVSSIRGARELRVKESDRISLLTSNLQALGVRCEELEDGLRVHGTRRPLSGAVRTAGDHRITMAFAALGASPGCDISLDDPECVKVSFPGFWEALARSAGRVVSS